MADPMLSDINDAICVVYDRKISRNKVLAMSHVNQKASPSPDLTVSEIAEWCRENGVKFTRRKLGQAFGMLIIPSGDNSPNQMLLAKMRWF